MKDKTRLAVHSALAAAQFAQVPIFAGIAVWVACLTALNAAMCAIVAIDTYRRL